LPEGLVVCQTRLVLKRKDRLIFKRVSLLSMVNFYFFISQTFVEDERFAHLTKEIRAELILSVSEKITVTYDVLARDMVSVVRITFSECH
jgi:ethanolamine ammonia-lyase large subunit